MNKELIQKRFGRKLSSYNTHAKIQKQMAEKLVSFAPQNNNSILEIGCGTGLLTQLVTEKLQFKRYIALDIVSGCEEFIKKINSNIEFINCDVENYIQDSEKFDLIISNASLQWIENMPEFVKQLASKLNKNGTLLFTTFGTENFREIHYVLGKTLPYYSLKSLQEKLADLSPILEEELRIMAFKTPIEVLKHIQKTGVNAISSEIWTKKDLEYFEKSYNNFCANHPTLTYNPVYVKIQNRLVG